MPIDWRAPGDKMGTVDLRELRGDVIVVHYGGALTSVDAYTFANSLIAFSDAARTINARINPGQSIEIRLEADGPGSYRAKIRTISKSLSSLFSDAPKNILWSIIGALISELMFGGSSNYEIKINENEIVLQRNDDRIVIPRDVYEGFEKVKKDPEVRRHIKRTFQSIVRDEAVENFGITARLMDPRPLVQIDRTEFDRIANMADAPVQEEGRRLRAEEARVLILKAWLNGGARKWSFEWNGVPISAPIMDEDFKSKLSSREFLIGSGDALDVEIEFEQQYIPNIGIFVTDNTTYRIVKVKGVIPDGGHKQSRLLE